MVRISNRLFLATAAQLLSVSLPFSINNGGNCQKTTFVADGIRDCTCLYAMEDDNDDSPVEEYKNLPTKILSQFMGGSKEEDDVVETNPIDSINFEAPKYQATDIDTLAKVLDYELVNKEWFVTGNVNPIYFSKDFEFQDPDVKLSGIEDYAKGVYKLFDQDTSRAEVLSTTVTDDTTITCTWRLSGAVNIGPGLPIKPYICYTDFTLNPEEDLLITKQEDRFDIPQWDILLSALFPFLIGKVTAPPAPPVEPRTVTMPVAELNPFAGILKLFQ